MGIGLLLSNVTQNKRSLKKNLQKIMLFKISVYYYYLTGYWIFSGQREILLALEPIIFENASSY